MSDSVIGLTDAADAPLSDVGGKARSLGRLERAGFRVPDGIVVAPGTPLSGLELATHLDGLRARRFAVRSSGVGEDGSEVSLAGRYRSVLDVDADSIPAAIAEVREGARLQDGVVIPVLVQTMIHPVCAGVAFTADPISGEREATIVSATGGLAEPLLSGEVPGDEWRVDGRRATPTRRPERVLERRLARRVARTAVEIAEEFGAPLDVEWAWDGSELWVVQARPITGLPDEVGWEPPAPGVYHRSLRFGEWIPEPVTPLFESWLLSRMERRLHDWLHEQIGQLAPEPLHVTVNGWYYYSLNWLPVPGVAFAKNFFNILRRLRMGWRKAAPMFPQTVRFGYQAYEDDWRTNVLPNYRQAVSRAEERVERLEPSQLVDLVDELATEAGSYFASITTVAGSAYKFEERLARFWNRHLKRKLDASHMVVLQGLGHAENAAGAPRLETLDWVVPPVDGRTDGPADVDRLASRRSDAERRAREELSGSTRRLRTFERLLAQAQHVVPVREEQLSQLSLPWPVMRRAVRRIGEALVDDGVVDSVDDVFYLTRPEVLSLLDEPEPMATIVSSRRSDRSRARRLAAPLRVGRFPPVARFLFSYTSKVMGAARSEEAVAHGVPASPGRATGRVRVVRDSSQFDEFQDGEVLVAPLTAPAWTDLFGRAVAVVTDVGSALAHASIIAREYGIPAVVGCGSATSTLRDGQVVTVDGSTGNVELAVELPARSRPNR